MKLYTYPGAPSPMRVELMLKYKGVNIDHEVVDLRAGDQLRDPFRSLNPRCSVPALIAEDGSCLTEVIAICLYLDELFPQKPVCGRDSLERAKIVNWMHRIFTDGFMAAAEALRNSSPNMKDRALPGPENLPQIPELAERGQKRLASFMSKLDEHLQSNGGTFIVGKSLTQADIDAFVTVNFAGWVKIKPPEGCEALLRWKQLMDVELA